MQIPPIPKDEKQRLAALRKLDILDTDTEERFDRIVRIAAHCFQVPIALFSLVDSKRQWFKSCIGLDVRQTDRRISFCGHAILSDDVFCVPDALADSRFIDNPLVSGSPRIRFYAGVPICTPEGHKVGTLCLIDRKPRQLMAAEIEVLRDLASCIQRELHQVQSNLLIDAVAHHTDSSVLISNSEGRLEWVNSGFSRLSGYSLEEVQGKRVQDFLNGPETDPKTVARIKHARRLGLGFNEELLNYAKDGHHYWVAVEARPFENYIDGSILYIHIERDISRRVERDRDLESDRQAAEAGVAARSRFIAVISHELRTPLNSVLGTLGLLEETDLNPEQRRFTETGRHSADMLLSLINDILDFSKLEAGKLALEIAPFQVRDLLDSIMEINTISASAKGLDLSVVLDDDMPLWLFGDVGRLRQILLNLTNNAIKFTERGNVTVAVCVPGKEGMDNENGSKKDSAVVRWSVSDSGIGISPKMQQRLFEDFMTTTETGPLSTGKEHGAGLGLAICRELVNAMGSEIRFRSEPGSGSTFWFDLSLPLVREQQIPIIHAASGAEPHLLDTRKFECRRVLVAEDNPANQLVIRSRLEKLGIRVDMAGDGREAVIAATRFSYDLILMDINMPNLDGCQALSEIRALPAPACSVPVVALTAVSVAEERNDTTSFGFDDLLAKPIVKEELHLMLERFLGPDDLRSRGNSVAEVLPPVAPVLDRSVLEQLAIDTAPDLVPEMIEVYLTTYQDLHTRLTRAFEAGNLVEIDEAGHSLKSSSRGFGALALGDLAEQLESAAAGGDKRKVTELMGKLDRIGNDTVSALRDFTIN